MVLNVQRPGIVKQQLFAPVQGNKTCKIYAALWGQQSLTLRQTTKFSMLYMSLLVQPTKL